MSDFFANLIATHLLQANVLQPQLPALFEPALLSAGSLEETIDAGSAQSRMTGVPRAPEVRAQSMRQAPYQPGEPQRLIEPPDSIDLPRPIRIGQLRPITTTAFTPTSQVPSEQRETHSFTEQAIERETAHGIVVAPQIRSGLEAAAAPRSINVINPPRVRSTIEQSATAAPSVNVTIGRLEVRATTTATPAREVRRAANVLSLEDYLHQRNREAQR